MSLRLVGHFDFRLFVESRPPFDNAVHRMFRVSKDAYLKEEAKDKRERKKREEIRPLSLSGLPTKYPVVESVIALPASYWTLKN